MRTVFRYKQKIQNAGLESLESRRLLTAPIPLAVPPEYGANHVEIAGQIIHAIPDQWIVRLDDVAAKSDDVQGKGTSPITRMLTDEEIRQRLRPDILSIRGAQFLGDPHYLRVNVGMLSNADQVLSKLSALPGVVSAQPDAVGEFAGMTVSDPNADPANADFHQQWLQRISAFNGATNQTGA